MLLTHEQAHTAHAIMQLAQQGGATGARVYFLREGMVMDTKGAVFVEGLLHAYERYDTLADFAAAYDVEGTAQRHRFAEAAQSWANFCEYHAATNGKFAPAVREQFERLSVAGRVTKMILGSWA